MSIFPSLASRSRRRLRPDDGTTLIDLMVAMVLMSIFMGMFTGSVIMMNNAMNKAQAVNATSGQLNQAFQTMDRTVRYASAISVPGTGVTGDWYVELRNVNGISPLCTQLRIDTIQQKLVTRSWQEPSFDESEVFVPLASNITSGSFSRVLTLNYQQLTVVLASLSAPGSSQTTSSSSFTLNALNSSILAADALICQAPPGQVLRP